MAIHRNTVLATLILSASIVAATPALAGFELIAPKPVQRALPAPQKTTPMPIAPAAPVEEIPLNTYQSSMPETSYAPRIVRPNSSVELFIDPYPMQSQGTAPTAPESAYARAEQNTLRDSGHLRGVATSGNRIDMVPERGNLQVVAPQHMEAARASIQPRPYQSITPIPGGEGASLPPVSAEPLQPVQPEPVVSSAPSVRPVYPAPAPVMPRGPEEYAAVPAPASQPQSSGMSEAVGFGRDLPLALALSQVVPPDYTFSFAQDVNAGETVSWQGGKPWDAVLNDMLAPVGMRAVISGNQVIVGNAS